MSGDGKNVFVKMAESLEGRLPLPKKTRVCEGGVDRWVFTMSGHEICTCTSEMAAKIVESAFYSHRKISSMIVASMMMGDEGEGEGGSSGTGDNGGGGNAGYPWSGYEG